MDKAILMTATFARGLAKRFEAAADKAEIEDKEIFVTSADGADGPLILYVCYKEVPTDETVISIVPDSWAG